MKNILIHILIITTLTACTTSPASFGLPEPTPTKGMIAATVTAAPVTTDEVSNKKILFVKQANYYLANPDGSGQVLLYPGEQSRIEMASLSQDGAKFAYFLDNVVYIQDIKTSKTTTLSKEDIGAAGGDQIRWSPDGSKLALSCSIEQQPSSAICLIDSQTGEIEVLLNEKNTDKFCSSHLILLLDWSKDGRKIVYECYSIVEKGQKPNFLVYFYDFTSKTSKRIFGGETQDMIWGIRSVSISPDNNLLLISGEHQDHIGQVFLLDLSNNAFKQLTNETGYDSSALVWMSDSKHFYLHKTSVEIPYPESNFLMNTNGEVVSSLKIEGTILK